MSQPKFEFGDRVRHARRPEWGIGSIVKTEELTLNGRAAQRVAVRFPNAGLKTISTAHAELQLVTGEGDAPAEGSNDHVVATWAKMTDSDWLGKVAQRKVEEAMVGLAPEVRDPFNSLRKRLEGCLDLYRFERSGRGVIDWAVAQSGLSDPLSRFTRHELEAMFDQWATHREEHLGRLLENARDGPELIAELLKSAPRDGVEAVRRLSATR